MKKIGSITFLSLSILALTGYGFLVYAAAPSGGYTPGATLDPDCAPGDTDCIVQSSGGAIPTNGLSSLTGGIGLGGTLTENTVIDQGDFQYELSRSYDVYVEEDNATYNLYTGLVSGLSDFFVGEEGKIAAGFVSTVDVPEYDFHGEGFIGLATSTISEPIMGPYMAFKSNSRESYIGVTEGIELRSDDLNSSDLTRLQMTPDQISLFSTQSIGLYTGTSSGVFFAENDTYQNYASITPNGTAFGNGGPEGSALLTLNSTTKGFLMPRMTESERDAIVAPNIGLQIYNTDDNEFNYYNGSSWVALGGGGGSSQWTDVASGYTLNQVQGSGLDDVTVSGNYNYSVEFVIQIVGNAGDTTLELGSYTEPFSNGQTVTGQTSGATATVHNFTEFGPHLFLEGVSGTFIPGEVITNNDNAGTADVVSAVVTTSDSFLWLLSGLSQFAVVQMTGSAQILFDSFSATWASTAGHTIGDQWLLTIQQSGIAYNSGVVGIGTVSPAADLTVDGSSLLRGADGDHSLQLIIDPTGQFLGNSALLLSHANSSTGDNSGLLAFEGVSRMFAGNSGNAQIELEDQNFELSLNNLGNALNISSVGFNFLTGVDWTNSGEENKFFFDTGEVSGTKSIRLGSVDNDNWDSTNRGARSIAIGFAIPSFSVEAPLATGDYSIALGSGATASGIGSLARGFASIASGAESIALGGKITASGDLSFAIGNWNTAFSYNEAVLGAFATEYIPVSAVGWDTADRLFNIGNGNGPGTESDAFTILKSGQIGIGIDNFEASADPSALLTLSSVTQGFLAPRMSQAERDVISSPANGLMVYNTDTSFLNIYNGSLWTQLNASSSLIGSTSSFGNEAWFGDGAGAGGNTSTVSTTFIGQDAGGGGTNTAGSTFVGTSAGSASANASQSTFIGSGAGTSSTNASGSVFIGTYSGSNALTAANSIFIGSTAGSGDTVDNTTNGLSDTSILIGSFTSTGGFSNSIALGSFSQNTAENQFILGSVQNGIQEMLLGVNAINPYPLIYANLGGVAIGASSVDSSAILDLTSTAKGFLAPRMTESERDAIDSPATGLQIYNTDDNEFNYYNGTSWTTIGGGGIPLIGSTSSAGTETWLGDGAGDSGASITRTTFIGVQAGSSAGSADDSTFVGYQAGVNATFANNSSFFGGLAGFNATNAVESVFVGYAAGNSATNATKSTFIGNNAGTSSSGAAYSIFIGDSAGSGSSSSTHSVFIGYQAAVDGNGEYSTFIGDQAGYDTNDANYSNLLGYRTAYGAEAQSVNFVGYRAGFDADGANYANFFGYDAGYQAIGAENSIFIGRESGKSAPGAERSIFIGYDAGRGTSDASNSIFIGTNAGFEDTVDNSNDPQDFSILIGSGTSTDGNSNSIALGSGATNTTGNQFMIGSTSHPINTLVLTGASSQTCTLDVSVSSPSCTSDERLKTNISDLDSVLDLMSQVRTVTYNWKGDPNGDQVVGFLAQDLEQYFPTVVGTAPNGYKTVSYGGMTPILVKAVQELDLKIEDIESSIGSEDSTITETLRDWLADTMNGINDLFAKRVRTEELCIGDTCVTEAELQQLLQNQGMQPIMVPVMPEGSNGAEEIPDVVSGQTENPSDESIESVDESTEEITIPEPAPEEPPQAEPEIEEGVEQSPIE